MSRDNLIRNYKVLSMLLISEFNGKKEKLDSPNSVKNKFYAEIRCQNHPLMQSK